MDDGDTGDLILESGEFDIMIHIVLGRTVNGEILTAHVVMYYQYNVSRPKTKDENHH